MVDKFSENTELLGTTEEPWELFTPKKVSKRQI